MKPYKLYTKLIVIILIFVPIISFSQGKWTYFTKKDVLLSDKVYGSLADKRGNVWFLTHKGMSRFDGTEWVNYNSAELKMIDKFKYFEDSKGNIWFWPNFFADGVAMFDGKNFSFPSKTSELTCDKIEVITEDSKGRIWIGGRNGWMKGRIDIFDGERYHNYNFNGTITNLYNDTKGNMWITSEGTTAKFSTNYYSTTTTGDISMINSDSLLTFNKDNDLPVYTRIGLPGTTIVFEDSRGNIWFNGLYGGKITHSAIIQINEQNWKWHHQDMGKVYRFVEDIENNIWAFSKKGTYIYNGEKWRLAWGMGKINSVLKDNRAIWIGMNVGIGKHENGKWKFFRPGDGFGGVNVIFKDSKGNIWFGGDNVYLLKNNEWVMKNGKPGLIKLSDVSNIIEDKAGNIWISTEKKGVVRYTE